MLDVREPLRVFVVQLSLPNKVRPMLDRVLQTIESRKPQSLAALKEWLALPRVSTKPEHAPDMMRAAQWLADQLKFGGLDVSIMQTGQLDGLGAGGAPAVVAKN